MDAGEKIVRLNLGCGRIRLAGYINIDLHRDCDYVDDAAELGSFADGAADEILASHLLEHFTEAEAPKALATWHRKLKPGGMLHLIVPTLDGVMRAWLSVKHEVDLNGGDPDRLRLATLAIYGNQKNPGEFHRSGWWERKLQEALWAAGFRQLVIQSAEHRLHQRGLTVMIPTLDVTAWKKGPA